MKLEHTTSSQNYTDFKMQMINKSSNAYRQAFEKGRQAAFYMLGPTANPESPQYKRIQDNLNFHSRCPDDEEVGWTDGYKSVVADPS